MLLQIKQYLLLGFTQTVELETRTISCQTVSTMSSKQQQRHCNTSAITSASTSAITSANSSTAVAIRQVSHFSNQTEDCRDRFYDTEILWRSKAGSVWWYFLSGNIPDVSEEFCHKLFFSDIFINFSSLHN